jgi:hypothetical protein
MYVFLFAASSVGAGIKAPFQGPDEVHIQQIGQRELKRAAGLVKKAQELKKREDALLAKHNIKASL